MTIKKKDHPKFVVPNFGAKHRKGVKARWRKQRGIDNKKRVKRSGYGAVPNIGYKNNETVRHRRPDGTRGLVIHNMKELEMAANAEEVSLIFAHELSDRKREELGKFAISKGLRIVNWVRK